MGCKSTSDMNDTQVDYTGPPTMVYKMKKDYSNLVPVVLNEEKTEILVYPAPKDLYNQKRELRFPLPLDKGFYLDEIGIGLNTAYISLTIDEYAHLLEAPSRDSLFTLIVDHDPFKRMYNLGNRKKYFGNDELVKEIVASGKYKKYKRLK